jgi:hypothetical protein
MYVTVVPNRSSPPAILLRESYREAGKVKNRTLANLSRWPPERIEALRRVLRGEQPGASTAEPFEITRSRPHGHVAAVVGTLHKIGLHTVIGPQPSRQRGLVEAMIAARILEPRSKLATARGLDPKSLLSTLAEVLEVQGADEDELYEAMDWLLGRQQRIEAALAKRHLSDGTLVLYDVSSTYFEGRHCPLAKLGHSRDGKKGKPQIVFGLLCSARGCPVAVEVFAGNTGDPKTLGSQVRKLRERFGLSRLVLVGDRGMITQARIRADLKAQEGLDWITALRAPAIQKLLAQGAFQMSLFDETDLAEIESPDYPGERLIVCKNPLLSAERARKREELLRATEKELDRVVAATSRPKNALRGKDRIGLRAGKVLGRYKMGKHFKLEITEGRFAYQRNEITIAREAELDGVYVIRTSVSADTMGADDAVRSYKRLSEVERAFRSLKTVDLKVRPIHHRLEKRVRAHVLLCMLAYYVEWHMRQALAPMLFDDEQRQQAETLRSSVVAPARRSPSAQRKARDKRTEQGHPVHSFQTLLRDLATVAKNTIQPTGKKSLAFDKITLPTPMQRRAFELLDVPYRM